MAAPKSLIDRPAVLVVDDDDVHRQTVRLVLRRHGVHVEEAGTGAAALEALRAHRFDLALLDERLPDRTGLQIAETLGNERIWVPWLLMSAFMDAEMAFEAGRLGAVTAVSLPFDIEHVVLSTLAVVQRSTAWPPVLPIALPAPRSGCAAGRLAYWLVASCQAEDDPKTLDGWAAFLARRCGHVTTRHVTKLCTVAGLEPIRVRDLGRVLYALWHARGRVAYVGAYLDIEDEQTLRQLLHRAGLDRPHVTTVSLEQFLFVQRFVPHDHPLVTAIRGLFRGPVATSAGPAA
jgi:DNA-binding response OmpR family regulator